MQNFLLYFAAPIKIIFSISQLVYSAEQPPNPRLSPEAMSVLESRVSNLERRVNALEGKTEVKAECDCGETGICDCPDSCDCKNCPKHKATEHAFSGEGRETVVFGATWCKFCPDAKKAAEACGIPYIDVDENKALADKYSVDSLPQIVRFQDGEVKERFVGSSVNYAHHIRSFQNPSTPPATVKTASRSGGTRGAYSDGDASDEQIRQHLVDAHGYSWGQVSRMNRSALKAAHDRGHGGPARVSLDYPVRGVRYQPRVYYTQPAQSYCPNCVRR